MTFSELSLKPAILKAIEQSGYTTPTAIQQRAIPYILQGRDMIGCAQTGTGKTAAFAIPTLQLLNIPQGKRFIQTLVVTPTRELALQVEKNFKTYSAFMQVSICSIYGGVPQQKQVNRIKAGVDILIATPGRLLDLVNQKFINLSTVNTLILDEADQMLDMGFVHDIKRIVQLVPQKRQTLLFSATMPTAIKKFAATILNNPAQAMVTPVSSAAVTVTQSVYYVEKPQKTALLLDILKDINIQRSLVFTRTKHGADRLTKQLAKTGIFAAAIHGNKSQSARNKALDDFKHSKIRVLVATDIAARGLDITELPHVVNYEIPEVAETYVHRIGRTGRAGASGVAISFCGEDEKDDFKQIQKLIGKNITVNNYKSKQ